MIQRVIHGLRGMIAGKTKAGLMTKDVSKERN
jgi:hypothetical protein